MKGWAIYFFFKTCESDLGRVGSAPLLGYSNKFGTPLTLKREWDTKLKLLIFQEIVRQVGCGVYLTSVSVGLAERAIQQAKAILRIYNIIYNIE